eukprot:758916-Pelagomonas_calceolata.AAC.4
MQIWVGDVPATDARAQQRGLDPCKPGFCDSYKEHIGQQSDVLEGTQGCSRKPSFPFLPENFSVAVAGHPCA